MVFSQVFDGHTCRKTIAHQIIHRVGQKYLAAVPGRKEPSYTVHRLAEVVSSLLVDSPCVESHPHIDRANLFRPLLVMQGLLRYDGSVQGMVR